MKVLVTGASGFIGNYVVQELLQKQVEVVATSSHLPANPKSWFSKVNYFEFDILGTNEFLAAGNSLMQYFDYPDKLIHLAWRNSSQHQLPAHFDEELPAHYVFLKAFIDEGLSDLTVTGTSFEYGNQTGVLDEQTVSDPNTFYGLAKYSLYKALEIHKKRKPFALKWVRLFNIFGTGTQDNTLLSQLDSAVKAGMAVFNMSGGEQVRDFLAAEKAAEYLTSISLQNETEGIINCCSSEPKSVKRFVEEYLQKNNYSIKLNLGHYPYRDYEPMAIWGNNHKLLGIINQEPH